MIKYKSCTRNINLITRFFKHIKTTHGGKRSYKQKNLKMHKINLDYFRNIIFFIYVQYTLLLHCIKYIFFKKRKLLAHHVHHHGYYSIIKKKKSIHTTILHVLGIQIQIYNIWETVLQVDYVHLEKYSYTCINNHTSMYI